MRSDRTPEDIIEELEMRARFLRIENAALRDENGTLRMVVAGLAGVLLFVIAAALLWGG